MTTFPLMRALCSSGGEWQQGLHRLLVLHSACELCILMINLDAFTRVRSILRWQPTPEHTLYRTRCGGSSTCPCPSFSRALALPSLIPLPHPSDRATRKISCCFKASIIQRFLKWIIISVRRRASEQGEEKGEDEEADDGDADDDLCEKKSCKGFYLTDPGKEGERQLQMPQLKRATAPADCRNWTWWKYWS